MRAFFDECGLDATENKALILGGYLGTLEELEAASEAWDDSLAQSPRIAYFKREEAKGLNGEFYRFSRAEAEKKQEGLASIIASSRLQGFCISVRHDLLSDRGSRASKGQAGSRTYDWGFFTATSGVLQYVLRHHPEETVDFVFDERRELSQCIAYFLQIKDLAEVLGKNAVDQFSRAGTCTSADDKKVAALQMADLLAGEFSDIGNMGSLPSTTWERLASSRSIMHIPCDMPLEAPFLVALQGMGKQIKDASGRILRRFYRDRERSPELSVEFDLLIADQIRYEAALKTITEIHELDERFRRFQSLMNLSDEID